MTMRHLITLKDWSEAQILEVLDLAAKMKTDTDAYEDVMHRRTLFMIFEKPSLRTRVSFEVAMNQMGGHAIYYDLVGSPLGKGKESLYDTVKTVSRFGDLIMARLFDHDKIEEMARHAEIPVINGLTDFSHPCQILADLLTIREHKRGLKGRKLAYLGDSHNNVTHSLMEGCAKVGMHVSVGCPPGNDFMPDESVVRDSRKWAGEHGCAVEVTHDARAAVKHADVVYTDSWMSYHIPPEETESRVAVLKPYQVNSALMAAARPDAIFMNCLPAMRGYEQTADVIDGPQSVVFDEAENRLHTQKALMKILLEAAAG